MYLGREVGHYRPSVEFAVRVVGELARAEGECVLRTEDEYCKHTRSNGPLSPRCTPYFLSLMYWLSAFLNLKCKAKFIFFIFAILQKFRAAGGNGFLRPPGESGFFHPIGPERVTSWPLFRSENGENRAWVTKKLLFKK